MLAALSREHIACGPAWERPGAGPPIKTRVRAIRKRQRRPRAALQQEPGGAQGGVARPISTRRFSAANGSLTLGALVPRPTAVSMPSSAPWATR